MLNYMLLNLRLLKSKFLGDESGAVELIVIVILIAIVVVLAIAFKDKIVELISDWFGEVDDVKDQATEMPSF